MFTEADFMLDIAVAFLADEFNAYLQRRTGSLALGRAGIGVIMPAANASAMRHATGMLASAAPAAASRRRS